MITETMVLIALKQKNWLQAETMSKEIAQFNPSSSMGIIFPVAKIAPGNQRAAYLLSLWAEIRWREINDDTEFI